MKASKDRSNPLGEATLSNALRADWHNFATLFLLILFASLPLAAQDHGASNSNSAPAASQAMATAAADPSYTIGPDDVLDISVWKEPDVSRVVPVRPDGKISLPLVNDVQAAGITPNELAASLTEKFKKYLNDPQVTVIVTQINSRRIYVVGEVTHPGAFPLLPDMTVLQALADAGGFTPYANSKKIHVLRMVNGKQTEFPFQYKEVLAGSKASQNIKLIPGDEIVVP
ncbi:MAG: polysaccharide biosynthesis/export family protein [Candidatus Acidiferrales bacterium]